MPTRVWWSASTSRPSEDAVDVGAPVLLALGRHDGEGGRGPVRRVEVDEPGATAGVRTLRDGGHLAVVVGDADALSDGVGVMVTVHPGLGVGAGARRREAGPEDEVDDGVLALVLDQDRVLADLRLDEPGPLRALGPVADLGRSGDLLVLRVVRDLADDELAQRQLAGGPGGEAVALGRVVDVDVCRRGDDRPRADRHAGRGDVSARLGDRGPVVGEGVPEREEEDEQQADDRDGRAPPPTVGPGGVHRLRLVPRHRRSPR